MTWFKVDDRLHSHPKWLATPAAARALWVTAGSWSAANLTDGRVPKHVLPMLGGRPRDAAALVAAGLWLAEADDFRFHDWTTYQPTKADVLADRSAAAARQTVARSPELREAVRARDADRCRFCGAVVQWSNRRGPLGGTYDHVIPDGGSGMNNLVVACRGCNSAKGRRTPEQAGMRLRPAPMSGRTQNGAKSDSSPDSDRTRIVLGESQDPDPTRPDPTRPDVPTEHLGGGKEREATPPGPPPPASKNRPPRHCPQHTGSLDDPPCRACADARRAADTWQPPTPIPSRPECPRHPGRPTGSKTCPDCAREAVPPPNLRTALHQTRETPPETPCTSISRPNTPTPAPGDTQEEEPPW